MRIVTSKGLTMVFTSQIRWVFELEAADQSRHEWSAAFADPGSPVKADQLVHVESARQVLNSRALYFAPHSHLSHATSS